MRSKLLQIGAEAEGVHEQMGELVSQILVLADELIDQPFPPGVVFWDHDLRDELPTREPPYGSPTLTKQGGWWKRRLDQITGVTFHHTLSHSPHATAMHYLSKGGGRPSIPYHVWITEETGDILYCLDLTQGCWHNHNGNKNKEISVGLAGHLHKYRPSDALLHGAAYFAAWALLNPDMHVIWKNVRGHQDYVATQCPGWHTGWRPDLIDRIAGFVPR